MRCAIITVGYWIAIAINPELKIAIPYLLFIIICFMFDVIELSKSSIVTIKRKGK